MSTNNRASRPSSRPSTPSRSSRYLPKSRSLPQPKVLPFPDIPVRPLSGQSSRATSRAPSPLHSPPSISHSLSPRYARLNSEHATPINITTSSDSADSRAMSDAAISPPNTGSRLTFALPTHASEPGPSRRHASSVSAISTQPIPIPSLDRIQSSVQQAPLQASPSSLSVSTRRPPQLPSMTAAAPAVLDLAEEGIAAKPPVKKASSVRSTARPLAQQITPPTLNGQLADHMHSSFLKGTCADIRLVVRKWRVAYHAHKMVLTQAGFFHSLFLGGFSETAGHHDRQTGKNRAICKNDAWAGESVELTFDDPNITRAAFEICLSRLYSPYPHLQFPTHLLPTPQCPLSESFPPSDADPKLESVHESVHLNTHLATPRLLLSILATTIYLGHAPLLHEALTIVLRTVGPHTVGRYQSFAQGHGIGEEEWEGQNGGGARGMEAVAHPVGESFSVDTVAAAAHLPAPHWGLRSSSVSDDDAKVRGSSINPNANSFDTPSRVASTSWPDDSSLGSIHELPHFYGFTSNKIGEACACWLSRWSVDLLEIEESLPFPSSVAIWSHRGLPSSLVRAVLCSDFLFVQSEMERYKVARRILDLRRKGWEIEMGDSGDLSVDESQSQCYDWEQDEEELAQVFSQGIYYTHMTFEDLNTIASDVDPHTLLPFVPLAVLQAAHWAAAELRNRITSPTSLEVSDVSPTCTASALGAMDQMKRRVTPRSRSISFAASNNSSALSGSSSSPVDLYHPIPSDDTYRIGAGGLILAVVPSALPNIPDLPDLGPEGEPEETSRPSKHRPLPQGEKTAFGLLRGCRTRAALLEEHALSMSGLTSSDTTSTKWTRSEPFRFSVEFWGLDKLAEKERAYSETFFYAGSWFNVYAQTIRKKDKTTQLGIYLHRQSPAEAFPQPCKPQDRGRRMPVEPTVGGALGLSTNTAMSGLYRAISTTPVAIGSPETPTQRRTSASHTDEHPAPYKDPRRVTKAYFSISCASALGTALIRFSSAPDSFTNSQSWGWKSAALRSEEYLSTIGEDNLEDGVLGWAGEGEMREGSLRASVVVGVV